MLPILSIQFISTYTVSQVRILFFDDLGKRLLNERCCNKEWWWQRSKIATTNNNKTFKQFLVGVLFIEVNTHRVRARGRGHSRGCGGGCRGWRGCGRVHWCLSARCTSRLGKHSLGGQETIHFITQQQNSTSLTPLTLSLHTHKRLHGTSSEVTIFRLNFSFILMS